MDGYIDRPGAPFTSTAVPPASLGTAAMSRMHDLTWVRRRFLKTYANAPVIGSRLKYKTHGSEFRHSGVICFGVGRDVGSFTCPCLECANVLSYCLTWYGINVRCWRPGGGGMEPAREVGGFAAGSCLHPMEETCLLTLARLAGGLGAEPATSEIQDASWYLLVAEVHKYWRRLAKKVGPAQCFVWID